MGFPPTMITSIFVGISTNHAILCNSLGMMPQNPQIHIVAKLMLKHVGFVGGS